MILYYFQLFSRLFFLLNMFDKKENILSRENQH